MIRYFLLTLTITFLVTYAWKDWYKSLCGLIILMAFLEHPDMPKSMLGVQGLNPFNIVLISIILAWVMNRQIEGLTWDMSSSFVVLILLYLFVITLSFLRLFVNIEELMRWGMPVPSTLGLWSEYFINTVKWIIPGMLIFDGCRSSSRCKLALFSIAALYFLISLQTIKWMLPALLSGGDLAIRSVKILKKEIGYHRTTVSAMLSGGSWAILSLQELVNRKRSLSIIVSLAGMTVFVGQALTAGRGGYIAWLMVGLVLSVLRWRKYLLIGPLFIFFLITFVPSIQDRILEGFSSTENTPLSSGNINMDTVSAGRTRAWFYVIEKIKEGPWIGYGRLAHKRLGIASFLSEEFNDSVPHPHNAYLQFLLDNGWIQALPVFFFYILIIVISLRLFSKSQSPLSVCVGGFTFAIVFSFIVTAMFGQTFYPREASLGMWSAIGLVLRVFTDQLKFKKIKAEEDQLWEEDMLQDPRRLS